MVGLLVTVDIRRGLKELDWVMLNWAQTVNVPATVLLTKADKLSRGAALSPPPETFGRAAGYGERAPVLRPQAAGCRRSKAAH